MVWLAVLWIFASVLGSLAAAICFDFASLALRTWAFVHEAPGSVASGLAAAAGAHSVLLWATWRRAAIVGQGDRSAGLGNTVTRRRWLVPVAFVVKLGAIAGTTVSMGVVLPGPPFKDPEHQVMALAWAQGPVLAVLNILWATIIAPLAEESFFRGWLWTGLRRHWSPGWTGVVTGGLWIFVHIGSGLPKMVALIPAAVLYSVVRHYCGSVRATIVLHVLNNSLAVASSLFIDISE